MYQYGLTRLRLSCPHAGVTDTSRWLPPPLRPPGKKKKKNEFLGFWGGAVWMLAGCVGCSCVLLRLFGFTLSLPKVASHGDDVGNDSWLKWQSTLLTVLRHSWICRRHRIG